MMVIIISNDDVDDDKKRHAKQSIKNTSNQMMKIIQIMRNGSNGFFEQVIGIEAKI